MFKMNAEQRNHRLDLAQTQLARSAREADSEIAAAAARRPTGRAVLEPLPILPTAAALHCRCARSQGFAGLFTGHPHPSGIAARILYDLDNILCARLWLDTGRAEPV